MPEVSVCPPGTSLQDGYILRRLRNRINDIRVCRSPQSRQAVRRHRNLAGSV